MILLMCHNISTLGCLVDPPPEASRRLVTMNGITSARSKPPSFSVLLHDLGGESVFSPPRARGNTEVLQAILGLRPLASAG
jgi:hypothetical protein